MKLEDLIEDLTLLQRENRGQDLEVFIVDSRSGVPDDLGSPYTRKIEESDLEYGVDMNVGDLAVFIPMG